MTIDWGALAIVAVVSLGVGVVVVVLVSLALVGLSARDLAPAAGEAADGAPASRLSPAAGVAMAVLCLAAAAAIVLYGFYLLVI
jgi:hypothetical protein